MKTQNMTLCVTRSPWIVGGVSGFVSAVALQPFDLVKTRLQQDSSLRNLTNSNGVVKLSVPKVFHKIWVEEGRLALWKGTGATLARFVLFYSLSLMVVRERFATKAS